ncbi:hypothetical protein MEQU1_003531 [Malassezia equina]|uniref:Uncharacterized protein n=1 Tax=Malassezia equina TaxID=1381935 RepID=A0AAF0EFT8_9BASI|nr:hypothetical protein MEQU1_003531 [Malassezia equina]
MAPAFVMSFDARLAEVAAISSSTERLAAYAAFLDDVLQVRDVHDLATLLEAYVRGALLHRVNTAGAGLLVGRRLVPELLTQLEHASKVEASPLHDATTMCDEILPLIVPQLETHTALWDDELVAWRQWHAQQLEQLQRFREAACVLQACTPEAVRAARQASWPALCVKVVQLWLAAGDEAAAEHAFKSAKAAIHTVRDDEALWHDFCLCQAHLLASQQRFCDAAQRCMELGQSPRLAAAEQNTMTQLAALHALAASPSAARTQLLHQLAEDDRSWTWPFATALHRAARGQALRPVDTHTLAPVWHACHLAPASFGLSAAALAMSEHTLCALARSFSAVPLVGLAAHAQLDADVCEKILARLLAQAQLPPGSYRR